MCLEGVTDLQGSKVFGPGHFSDQPDDLPAPFLVHSLRDRGNRDRGDRFLLRAKKRHTDQGR